MSGLADVGVEPWLLLLKAVEDQATRDYKKRRYRTEHKLGGKCGWCGQYHYRFRPCGS